MNKDKYPVLVDKYIYKTHNNKYRLFIRSGDYYFSSMYNTLQEAKHVRKIKMSEKVLVNNKKIRNNATVNEFVNIWISIYCMKELKTTTTYSMKHTLDKYILPEIGEYKINQVTPLQLQKFFASLRDKDNFNLTGKVSDKTVYRVYKIMRNMFNKATEWKFVSENPIIHIRIKKVRHKETIIYSKNELLQILNLLRKENIIDKTMFSLLITTGIRKCELLGLHIDDINLMDKTIIINKNLNYDKFNHKYIEVPPKTNASYRIIPIPNNMVEILNEYLKYRCAISINSKTLFVNNNGKRIGFDYLIYRWNKFINKYNLKRVTLHGLRHSYCSMQINDNKYLNIPMVSKLMGHSQIFTTLKYLHCTESKNVCYIFDENIEL